MHLPSVLTAALAGSSAAFPFETIVRRIFGNASEIRLSPTWLSNLPGISTFVASERTDGSSPTPPPRGGRGGSPGACSEHPSPMAPGGWGEAAAVTTLRSTTTIPIRKGTAAAVSVVAGEKRARVGEGREGWPAHPPPGRRAEAPHLRLHALPPAEHERGRTIKVVHSHGGGASYIGPRPRAHRRTEESDAKSRDPNGEEHAQSLYDISLNDTVEEWIRGSGNETSTDGTASGRGLLAGPTTESQTSDAPGVGDAAEAGPRDGRTPRSAHPALCPEAGASLPDPPPPLLAMTREQAEQRGFEVVVLMQGAVLFETPGEGSTKILLEPGASLAHNADYTQVVWDPDEVVWMSTRSLDVIVFSQVFLFWSPQVIQVPLRGRAKRKLDKAGLGHDGGADADGWTGRQKDCAGARGGKPNDAQRAAPRPEDRHAREQREGYDRGYDEGYEEGYREGYEEGYEEGYDEGHEDEGFLREGSRRPGKP